MDQACPALRMPDAVRPPQPPGHVAHLPRPTPPSRSSRLSLQVSHPPPPCPFPVFFFFSHFPLPFFDVVVGSTPQHGLSTLGGGAIPLNGADGPKLRLIRLGTALSGRR